MPAETDVTITDLMRSGVDCHRAGRMQEAGRIYRQVLVIDPGHADALHLLGVISLQLQRYAEALSFFDNTLAVSPNHAEALSNRGNALQGLKRYHDALASYDQALSAKPGYVDALYNRGNALLELARFDEALASYDNALALKPDLAEAWCSHGKALEHLARCEQALISYGNALAIRPSYAEALNNRGNALQQLRRYQEALASYDQALAVKPDYAEALSNRGAVLQRLARYDEALDSCDRAIAIAPRYARALNNRGFVLQELKRYDEALESYAKAVAINPGYAMAHWNESLCRLSLGDFARGWAKYEWRWKCEAFTSPRRHFTSPLWLGKENLAGKTILLHAEQGLGDTIQFVRYVQAVAQTGATIVLECQPALESLLAGFPGVNTVVAQGNTLPDHDFHCPLLSLPLAFNTLLDTVPAAIPYLSVPDAAIGKWQNKLGPKTLPTLLTVPSVGIVCSGNAAHANDSNRSIAADKMMALSRPDTRLVSLQNALRPAEAAALGAHPQVLHFGAELSDFTDTAALVSLMDLVITVDTAVAHLAGALGKPVWILLPFAADWRWLTGGEHSPWYPTARLFRQARPGDWDSVVDRVNQALGLHVRENATPAS
jgi:tetratricopeptide (TPR) repeat protein